PAKLGIAAHIGRKHVKLICIDLARQQVDAFDKGRTMLYAPHERIEIDFEEGLSLFGSLDKSLLKGISDQNETTNTLQKKWKLARKFESPTRLKPANNKNIAAQHGNHGEARNFPSAYRPYE